MVTKILGVALTHVL